MVSENTVAMRVWGDYACFTRPEMKVERVSYSVMTPSAARGVLEAVFWEPEIYYLIDSIYVIQRGHWFSFKRNEVTETVSLSSVKNWMKDPKKVGFIKAGGGAKDGTQRNMLALTGVEYLIQAEVHLSRLAGHNPLQKYLGEIKRRLRSGKCFHRPYLGMREFSADFDYVEDVQTTFRERMKHPSKAVSEDLGVMLYDVFAPEARAHGFRWSLHGDHLADPRAHPERQKNKDRTSDIGYVGQAVEADSIYFNGVIDNGRMDCHPERVKWLRKIQ